MVWFGLGREYVGKKITRRRERPERLGKPFDACEGEPSVRVRVSERVPSL